MNKSLPLLLLATVLAASPAVARVGEPVSQIKERFGKPDPHSPKGMVIWFIEAANGPLVYTVNFNAKGISIAEGLKPLKNALLAVSSAKDFIQDQMVRINNSPTARVLKAGETYEFGGQAFVCNEGEFVALDPKQDLLIIWSQAGTGAVMALSREMLQRK